MKLVPTSAVAQESVFPAKKKINHVLFLCVNNKIFDLSLKCALNIPFCSLMMVTTHPHQANLKVNFAT